MNRSPASRERKRQPAKARAIVIGGGAELPLKSAHEKMPISKDVPQSVSVISREEMIDNALGFSLRWKGPQREVANAKSFLDGFFSVFGRDRQRVDAEHEHRVEREGRGDGRIDLLWKGKLIVEMKSTGEDLSANKGGAARQAFDYIGHLAADERPRWVLVSDFANFVLYDRGEDNFELWANTTIPAPVANFPLAELSAKLRSAWLS